MKEETNSEPNAEPISQQGLMARVLPMLRSEGKVYEKTRTIYARLAKEGEHIDTITSDGFETTNTAKKGDFIVKNKTEAEECYILSSESFNKTYEYLRAYDENYNEYIPNKKIIGLEINSSFFAEENEKELYFVAPWGAKMVVKENDFLVCPTDYSEIYRIARKEFFETYQLSSELESTNNPNKTASSTTEKAMPDQPTKQLRFFVSYSHKDEPYKDELVTHMASLRRTGAIKSWDDRQIPIGGEWDHQIKSEMNNADVILLLISSDFMNSSYCNDVEVTRAMERHHDNNDPAVVVPIILRHCDWTDAPFAKLQALPKNATPIAKYGDKDEAYLFIVKQIKNLIKLKSQPKSEDIPISSPTATPSMASPIADAIISTPSPQAQALDRDKVRNLIAQNKAEEALKIMIEVAKEKNSDNFNILLQKSGELADIKKQGIIGATSDSDLRRRKAKLSYDMLEILNTL